MMIPGTRPAFTLLRYGLAQPEAPRRWRAGMRAVVLGERGEAVGTVRLVRRAVGLLALAEWVAVVLRPCEAKDSGGPVPRLPGQRVRVLEASLVPVPRGALLD